MRNLSSSIYRCDISTPKMKNLKLSGKSEKEENGLVNALVKSRLAIVVLSEISDGERSGYEIIKAIEKKTGSWKPSAGSMYPLLKSLLSDGLVNVREDAFGRKIKYYSITSKGKKIIHCVHEAMHLKDYFIQTTMNSVNMLKCIEKDPKKRLTQAAKILSSLNEEQMLYPELNDQIMRINLLFLRIMSNKMLGERDKEEIKKLINSMEKKLSLIAK
jgi:DNA-binding PadR family transcriptional regulator